jgi:hypothetical protein
MQNFNVSILDMIAASADSIVPAGYSPAHWRWWLVSAAARRLPGSGVAGQAGCDATRRFVPLIVAAG